MWHAAICLLALLVAQSSAEPMDWLGKNLKFHARFDQYVAEEDLKGKVSVELQIFEDGVVFASLSDEMDRIDRASFRQRDQSIVVNDSPVWVKTLLEDLEKSCRTLAGGASEKDKEWLIACCNENIVGFGPEDLSIPEIKEATDLIYRKVELIFSTFDEKISDRSIAVENDGGEPMKVNISDVLSDQKSYDGKRISLDGYLLWGGTEALLYAQKKAEGTEPGGYAPFVEVADLDRLNLGPIKLGEFRRVSIEGTFYRGFWDAETQHAGRIERVSNAVSFQETSK